MSSFHDKYLELKALIKRTVENAYKENIVLFESKIIMPGAIRYTIVAAVYAGILALFIFFAVQSKYGCHCHIII